ncbi:hypothetical protein EDB80DRAFT_840891 [Ilyonectria destructans]|nr:hypothetical protein EDB80DRAFT_840891 [Ilyonectria destructans]
MQLTTSVLTLGSLATLASASALANAQARRSFQFPASVSIAKRAVTGAEYQCHASCGYTILDAEDDGYCDSSEWTELLAECLACATEYDLWPDYGDGVTAAAEACGLDATPAGASTTAAAAEETTAAAETTAVVEETTAAPDTTAAAEQTTAVEETETAETTAVEETAAVTTTAVVVESAATTPSVVTTPSSNSTSSIPTTSVVEGGAPEFAVSNIVAAGVALIAVAGLM